MSSSGGRKPSSADFASRHGADGSRQWRQADLAAEVGSEVAREPKTVIHFTDTNGFGGAEQMLLTILGGLDRRRWKPVLMHHGEPGAVRLEAQARKLGVETRAVPRMQGKRGVARLPGFVKRLRQEHAAVFHAHLTWPLACTYGLVGAALAGIPAIIATQHCFVPIQSRRLILMQKLVSAVVDRYIAVSEEMARGLRPVCLFSRRKVQVIHNGISLLQFSRPAGMTLQAVPSRATGRPIVLTISRLDRPKGLSDLLAAAALVPGSIFLLAGEGRERAALEEQARTLGVADRVLFLGHRDDVPDLLAACDVFVLPSHYEGLPISVLEAMAAGKPVIATAVGGTKEVVLNDDTGLLVPPRDPPALARAIRAILSDPAFAKRLASAGTLRVRSEFRAETMVERTGQLYDDILGAYDARHRLPSGAGG